MRPRVFRGVWTYLCDRGEERFFRLGKNFFLAPSPLVPTSLSTIQRRLRTVRLKRLQMCVYACICTKNLKVDIACKYACLKGGGRTDEKTKKKKTVEMRPNFDDVGPLPKRTRSIRYRRIRAFVPTRVMQFM